MQQFNLIQGQDRVKNSRVTINENFQTVASNFSGTQFPTTNVVVGMKCYRTDTKSTYVLVSANPDVWEEEVPSHLKTPIEIKIKGKIESAPVSFDGSKNIDIEINQVTADACMGNARTAGMADEVRYNRITNVNAPRHIWFSDANTETKRNADDVFVYNSVSQTLSVPKLDGQAATAVKDSQNNVIADTYVKKTGAGATGTWNINISGKANQATTADRATTAETATTATSAITANTANVANTATTAYNIMINNSIGNIWIQT